MNIRILINRIILNIDDLSSSQRRCLQTDIENELTSLISVNGIPAVLRSGGAVPHLLVDLRHISCHLNSTKLGYNIAYSIYNELEKRGCP